MSHLHHLRPAVDVPVHVPAGSTHVEYALSEAERSFQTGHVKDGIASLAHALFVLATKREPLTNDDARDWFNRIERAAGVWEQES